MESQQDGAASEELCKPCGKQHNHMSTPAQLRNNAQELATILDVANGERVSAMQTGY